MSMNGSVSFAREIDLVIVPASLVSESTRVLIHHLGNVERDELGLANVLPFPAKEVALKHFDHVLLVDLKSASRIVLLLLRRLLDQLQQQLAEVRRSTLLTLTALGNYKVWGLPRNRSWTAKLEGLYTLQSVAYRREPVENSLCT